MTSIRRYAWLFAIPVVLLVSGMPAHAATLEISVNYAHDWVSGVTDPSALVTVTLTDDVGGLKATGTATADGGGFFLVGGGDWSPGTPDIQPADRVYATVTGAATAVDPVGSIVAELDADTDVVAGTVHASWLTGPVAVRCAVWEDPAPAPIDTMADPDGGTFTCDFGSDRGWDLQPREMVAVMYYEPDGDSVINVPPWTWMRVDYGADEVGGDYPAGVIFDIAVKNSGGAVKATAQVVSTADQGWQGDGFFTQPGDWAPSLPDIIPGDMVIFSGDDGFLGDVRVGEIHGSVDTTADLVSGFISEPWLPANTLLDVECHPWGAWALGIDAPIITSSADADTDPGYACDWSTDPWNMDSYQPVGVIYFEPDGNGVIRVFGNPPEGFLFFDGFESGATSAWSNSVP